MTRQYYLISYSVIKKGYLPEDCCEVFGSMFLFAERVSEYKKNGFRLCRVYSITPLDKGAALQLLSSL